jgi:hypothetical protein
MLIAMFDSVDVSQIPNDADAVAGYVNGLFQTAPELAARFAHGRVLTIAVSAGADAECLDIETGDAAPPEAAGWYARQRARGVTRPCLYASASVMETGIVPVIRAGRIVRSAVRLWSAHYTGVAHICGPRSCGAVSIDMDGTQWTDRAFSRNLDQSLVAADFFGSIRAPTPKPAPPAAAPTVPQVREWTTAGQLSLAQLAAQEHCQVSAILRLTAERSPGAIYQPNMASLINGVFAGSIDPHKSAPAGLKLWLPS